MNTINIPLTEYQEMREKIRGLEHQLKVEKQYSASLVKIAVPVKADLTKTEKS